MDAGHAYADTALLDVPSCVVLTSPPDRPDASGHEDLAPFVGPRVRSSRAELVKSRCELTQRLYFMSTSL
jgi:hypothetical protein